MSSPRTGSASCTRSLAEHSDQQEERRTSCPKPDPDDRKGPPTHVQGQFRRRWPRLPWRPTPPSPRTSNHATQRHAGHQPAGGRRRAAGAAGDRHRPVAVAIVTNHGVVIVNLINPYDGIAGDRRPCRAVAILRPRDISGKMEHPGREGPGCLAPRVVAQSTFAENYFRCVTAPSDACCTSAAYLASTPCL
jgi:hypothetical protein